MRCMYVCVRAYLYEKRERKGIKTERKAEKARQACEKMEIRVYVCVYVLGLMYS